MPGVDPGDVVPDAFATILANYERHKNTIPRWITPDGDPSGGLWMETHSSRCLDNNSVLHPLVNIIEGIYGREGPFLAGPGPGGYGVDLLTNLVIFGKNALHVDNVGVYLAGHEPGNFGLFHLAMERGLSQFLDPRNIPVYQWRLDGHARRMPIEAFPRAAIRTPYLQQPGEPPYHMVDEPCDYDTRHARKSRCEHEEGEREEGRGGLPERHDHTADEPRDHDMRAMPGAKRQGEEGPMGKGLGGLPPRR
jgi:hypothetical protein